MRAVTRDDTKHHPADAQHSRSQHARAAATHIADCRIWDAVEWRRAVYARVLRCSKAERATHAEAAHTDLCRAAAAQVCHCLGHLTHSSLEVQVVHQLHGTCGGKGNVGEQRASTG